MRIIFVRHGYPNYRKDCLTELGHLQAKVAAKRLKNEGIEQIYTSTCGRAVETAEYTAKEIGITEIIPCDFMREVSWGSTDDSELDFGGHPWQTAEAMIAKGQSILEPDWKTKEPFCRNIVANNVKEKEERFDELLAELGYQREGMYYRVKQNTQKTIAVFSHAGASGAVLGHLLNVTFPFMCSVMPPECTSVTIVTLNGEEGSLISPKIELFNDAKHIEGIESEKGRYS